MPCIDCAPVQMATTSTWPHRTLRTTTSWICPAQVLVGQALGRKCASANCKFVINTGDNFYNLGINSILGVVDPQWNTSFHSVYSDASLQVPWSRSAGQPRLRQDQTAPPLRTPSGRSWSAPWIDPYQQWYLPNRYYDVSPGGGVPIKVTAYDT